MAEAPACEDRAARAPDDETLATEILRLRLGQLVINERYKAGAFKVPIHLALGHESLAVAISTVMRDGDMLLLSHGNIA